MSQRIKAEAMLVITTLVWGTSFVIVKGALRDASPFPYLAVRFTVAGLLMFGFMARGRLPCETLIPSVVLGSLLFTGYAFQTWGLTFTTPSKSAFITGSSVIIVPLIALILGHSIRLANTCGAALGLLGLYFLVMPKGWTSVNHGDVLTLVGAFAFAVHIVVVGWYASRHSFLHIAPGQIMAVAVLASMAVPMSPIVFHPTGRLILAIILTAVLATAFAFGVQVWAQQYTPPSHAALIFTLEPVFAALTSNLVFHERPGAKVLLGGGLILAGMVIAEFWGGTGASPVEA